MPPLIRDIQPPARSDELLEQYRLFVDSEERLVSRRQEENRFFLSVNALVLTVISLLLKQGLDSRIAWAGIVLLGAAGLVLCFSWSQIINSYRTLNEAKFVVIDEFEQTLPARMFGEEWDQAKERDYQPFTIIEGAVPFVFGALHAIASMLGLLGVLAIIH